MSKENKAIVRDFFEMGDCEGRITTELCAPGFTAYIPGSPPMDMEAFQRFGVTYNTSFSDFSNTVEEMVAEGDRVAFRFGRRATHTAEFMGIPASGKQISWTTK